MSGGWVIWMWLGGREMRDSGSGRERSVNYDFTHDITRWK